MTFEQAMQMATAEILNDPKAVAYYGEKGKPGYRAGRPEHPFDINCGFCEEWANRVVELVPEAEVVGVGNLTGNPDDDLEYPHVFVMHRGKFYDAETPQGVTNWKNLPAFQGRRREDVIERKLPADVVNSLLEADDDLDPKTYMMSLKRKRDVVQDLIKRYAVRHRWDFGEGERVAVTFPKDLDFKKLLADHGVPCANVMGISGGSKNYRLQFYWKPGELDGLIHE